MEIDITAFFNNACPSDYSASRAELGDTAAADTWRAANDDSEEYFMLDTEEKRDAFKAFAKSAGFSEADDFASWTPEALNALFIQWAAGDMREAGLTSNSDEADWQSYEKAAEDGHCSGNLYRGDDGRVYFNVES